MVFLLVGCSPYRSKGIQHVPEVDAGIVDYGTEQEEYDDISNTLEHNDVYHVKYVHITL